MNTEAIEAALMKEDKTGLIYILTFLDYPETRFYEAYTKYDLRVIVLGMRQHWHKLQDFATYRHFFNQKLI